jgi:hypothetical protein
VARILLAGMVAGDPAQGGATSAILQYLHGLRRLGHDVLLVEPVPELRPDVVRYFEGLGLERAFLLAGRPPREVVEFARSADVLLDVSGMLRDETLLERIAVRVFLDLDPAFNQIWAAQGIDLGLDAHTHFATVGCALGLDDCAVPTLGRDWIPTVPPVVLDCWPRSDHLLRDALTTVGNWRAYGSVEHEGVFYGQKAHALRPLAPLPARLPKPLELALAIDPGETADLELLAGHGWSLLDPQVVAGTPDAYGRFVRGSWAEFGLAKHGYVASRCGWFSDRSACYLASGRPVVALDTGFPRFLPTGEGLFAAASVDEIVAAVEQIAGNYDRHAKAAAELAREHFDSDRVLRRLLERLGGA